jgi:hypothetical protein
MPTTPAPRPTEPGTPPVYSPLANDADLDTVLLGRPLPDCIRE